MVDRAALEVSPTTPFPILSPISIVSAGFFLTTVVIYLPALEELIPSIFFTLHSPSARFALPLTVNDFFHIKLCQPLEYFYKPYKKTVFEE